MRKLLVTAAALCANAMLFAQTGTKAFSPPFQGGVAPRSASPTGRSLNESAGVVPAGDAKTHRAFVNKYCVGCHNSSNAQPASDPLNLEKASLDDVLTTA